MNKKFNPNKRSLQNESIKSILERIINGYPLEQKLNQKHIEEVWYKIMGNGIANYTQNIYLKNNTLFIKLNSAIVRDQLSYGKEKIISILNEEFDRKIIKDLKLL